MSLQSDPKWLSTFALRHAYIKEGEKLPATYGDGFLHVQGRDDGTGLDVWWYGPPEASSESPDFCTKGGTE